MKEQMKIMMILCDDEYMILYGLKYLICLLTFDHSHFWLHRALQITRMYYA